MSPEEFAFYDALAANQSAIEVMGDRNLAIIAHELVKRILKQYGYPPDLQEAATNTVLEQAELFASEWAG